MIRQTASLLAIVCILTPNVLACERPSPNFDHLQSSSIAFVGTVVGYRLDDTSLATELPDCPEGSDSKRSSVHCQEFWTKVVSIQYDVEAAIKGIEGHRKYEMVTGNSEGCVPLVGERWLTSGWFRDGFSMVLKAPPMSDEIALWRSIANTEPSD